MMILHLRYCAGFLSEVNGEGAGHSVEFQRTTQIVTGFTKY
jgi:hypothetical protein